MTATAGDPNGQIYKQLSNCSTANTYSSYPWLLQGEGSGEARKFPWVAVIPNVPHIILYIYSSTLYTHKKNKPLLASTLSLQTDENIEALFLSHECLLV